MTGQYSVVFAPFGKWEKALDGFAYNVPSSEFNYAVETEVGTIAKIILDCADDDV